MSDSYRIRRGLWLDIYCYIYERFVEGHPYITWHELNVNFDRNISQYGRSAVIRARAELEARHGIFVIRGDAGGFELGKVGVKEDGYTTGTTASRKS